MRFEFALSSASNQGRKTQRADCINLLDIYSWKQNRIHLQTHMLRYFLMTSYRRLPGDRNWVMVSPDRVAFVVSVSFRYYTSFGDADIKKLTSKRFKQPQYLIAGIYNFKGLIWEDINHFVIHWRTFSMSSSILYI